MSAAPLWSAFVGSSCGSCRNPEIHLWNQIRLWSSLQRQDAAARQGHRFFSACAVIIISSTYTRSSPPKWKPNKAGAGIIASQYALNIVNRWYVMMSPRIWFPFLSLQLIFLFKNCRHMFFYCPPPPPDYSLISRHLYYLHAVAQTL